MQRLKTQRVKLGENNYQDIIIKNHANNNDYFLNKDNLWIRNFGKKIAFQKILIICMKRQR